MNEEIILSRALELDPEEREDFLSEACGSDQSLRQRVEDKLRAYLGANSFPGHNLEDSSAEPTGLSDPDKKHHGALAGELNPPLESEEPIALNANPDASVPFIFGSRIAKGGMGAILEADDCKFGRKIAVKVMLAEKGSSEEQKLRFIQEAAVLGKLEHPNIVPVHDLGRDSSGDLYYSMKLVKGRTLQEVIDSLRNNDPDAISEYTLDRLLAVFRKVCDALSFAHSENIIHRDLKPENIMVGEFGEVLVMDWGLSKVLDGSMELISATLFTPQNTASKTSSVGATLEGSVLGTPRYMSPEQANGEIGEMDIRTDIYSLGAILYSILTLHPPFDGNDVYKVLSRVKNGDFVPFSSYESGGISQKKGTDTQKLDRLPHLTGGRIPPSLSAVAVKALALKKEDRYQFVSELARDVEQWQNGFATSAEGAGFTKQLTLLAKRNKGIVMTAATAWVFITGLAIWFVLNLKEKEREAVAEFERATRAESFALQNEEIARQKEDEALQSAAEARSSMASANLALAEASLREGNSSALLSALKGVPEDLRDSTWQYFMDRSDTSISQIDTGIELHDAVPHPVFPSIFVVADKSNIIRLINVRTLEELSSFEIQVPKRGRKKLAISPNGRFVAVGSAQPPWMKLKNPGIAIYSTEDGSNVFESKSHETTRLEYSPEGDRLLQAGYNTSNLTLWDTEKKVALWSKESGQFWGMASHFCSKGEEILLQCHNSASVILSASDGSVLRTVSSRKAELAALSGNEERVVTLDEKGMIRGLQFDSGQLLFEIPTGNQIQWFGLLGLAYTNEDDRFITALPSRDGTQSIQIWDANNGSLVRSLLGGSGVIRGAIVHPLSSELVILGKTEANVWNLGEARWVFRGNAEGSVAFWGDENLLLCSTKGRSRVQLVRLENASSSVQWTPSSNSPLTDVSANGKIAAISKISGASTGNEVSILRREGTTVTPVSGLNLGPAGLTALRISPEGSSLVAIASGYYNASLIDTLKGELICELKRSDRKRFNDFAWLSEDRLVGLVTVNAQRGNLTSAERLILWDTSTNKVIQEIAHPTTMDALAASPDGMQFAEAGFDRKVRIRDGESLAILKEFRGHDAAITALAWHPSRPILATASADLTVRLWDLETGDQLVELRGPRGAPRRLDFSPSGQRIACASFDSRVCIWEPFELKTNFSDSGESEFSPTLQRIVASENWPAISAAIVELATNHPDETRLWNELPGLLKPGQNFTEADGALSTALDQSDDNTMILLTRGRVRAAAAQWPEALEDLERAMTPGHKPIQDFGLRARAFSHHKKWKEAAADWTSYLAEYKDSGAAFRERAIAYAHLNEWEKCGSDFEKAIELAPGDTARNYRKDRTVHYWLPRGEWEAAKRDSPPVDLEAIQGNWARVRMVTLRQMLFQESGALPALLNLLKEKLNSNPSTEQVRCSLIPIVLSRTSMTKADAQIYNALAQQLESHWTIRLEASINLRTFQSPNIPPDSKDTWLQLIAAIDSQIRGDKESAVAWFKRAEASLLKEFKEGARHHVPSSRNWIEWAPLIVLYREAADRIEGPSSNAERRLISQIEQIAQSLQE